MAAAIYPQSHVGFDSITSQIEKKLLKRGFQFNVICVGEYINTCPFELLRAVSCRPFVAPPTNVSRVFSHPQARLVSESLLSSTRSSPRTSSSPRVV